jgi:4-hydroxybenzoate polyprenyltransferase
MLRKVATLLEMIKVQHTIFALPFAVVGAFYARGGVPPASTCAWILVAMVSARSAAMAFNRAVDARFDAQNPRTQARAIPRGLLSARFAFGFTAAMSGIFILSAGLLNGVVLALSPVALLVILGYSFTKRFTPLSHFVLGLGLALAPAGAWLAVEPRFDLFPLLLSGAVLFWVAGFDIIYACEDVAFDRQAGLHSMPAWLGVSGALRLARTCHAICLALLIATVAVDGRGGWFVAGVAVIAMLLGYEHALVRPDDLRRVNRAFFHVNAAVSLTLGTSALLDLLL